MSTTIVVATADHHIGSSLGLCPHYFERTNGDAYTANAVQDWAFSKWGAFWDEVRAVKAQLLRDRSGEDVFVWHVIVGDGPDKDRRGIERVADNPADLIRLASMIYDQGNDVVNLEFFVRGTPAHVGQQGWLEELIGKDREAVQNPDTEAYSWYHLPVEAEGVKVNFYHRPPSSGRLAHTEDLAPVRVSSELRARFRDAEEEVPDFAFFGHFHYFAVSSTTKKPIVIFLPSWQLPYDWIHSIGRGMVPQPVGGMILICRAGRGELVDHQRTIFRPRSTRRWRIQDLKT